MVYLRRAFRWWMSINIWAFCLCFSLLWSRQLTDAAIYRQSGICMYKEVQFQPGQTFYKGCDKCFCHETGYTCLSPMKPTSWPRKCQRIPTECGYSVVYKEFPEMRCRAYSWIWWWQRHCSSSLGQLTRLNYGYGLKRPHWMSKDHI